MAKKPYKIKDQADRNSQVNFASSHAPNFGDSSWRHILKNKTFWPFLILVIAIIFVGSWYFKTQLLEKHFALDVPDFLQDQLNPDQKNEAQLVEDLKNNDTDQDGLTDYQELYQYRTSMFLEDTDSDGYTDLEEVNSNNDPLCPSGADCNLLYLITPNTSLSQVIEEVTLNPDLTIEEAALIEFRNFLVDNGMSQEDVDIFSILDESGIGSESPEDLGVEHIRAFLLTQPGADAEEINNLSEEELLGLRNQLLDL